MATIKGNSEDKNLFGTTGNDNIYSGRGRESLIGGDGNDILWFESFSGDDTVSGGAGVDTLDFSLYAANGVYLDISLGSKQFYGGGSDAITLAGPPDIERVIGTRGNDVFAGNALDNEILGMAGNDFITGGDGNDKLTGDSATTSGMDTLSGGDGNDTLDGGAGADSLNGGIGYDSLIGGAGDDILNGGENNDMMIGGLGNDTYYTSSFDDKVIEAANAGIDTVYALQGVSLMNFVNVENITGLADYTYTGSNGNNVLTDAAAVDDSLVLRGLKGDDTYVITTNKTASITLDELENEGNDTLDMSRTSANINISLGGQTFTQGNVTHNAKWIENFFGGSGQDTITGTSGANVLSGGAGDDTLTGNGGNDVYKFADNWGNDTIVTTVIAPPPLPAIPIPVTGIETLDFTALTTNLTASLTIQNTAEIASGSNTVNIDGISGQTPIENILGGKGNNEMYGGAADNLLVGNIGSDTLSGQGGNDTLRGGDGADVLSGGLGNDLIEGGTGIDFYVFDDNFGRDVIVETGTDITILNFETMSANLKVVLSGDATSKFAGTQIAYVDDANHVTIGSTASQALLRDVVFGTGNDVFIGNALANSVSGEAGNDSMSGGAGNDTLDGGFSGNDTLDGGANNDQLFGRGGNDSLLGGANDDILNGGGDDDTLNGGDGNDTYRFDASFGKDSLLDSTGVDTLDFSNFGAFIRVNLSQDADSGATGFQIVSDQNGNNTVTVASAQVAGAIENIIGTSQIDALTGNALNNFIDGGAGGDSMYGGKGNDTYVIDNINDKPFELFNEGIDTLRVGVNGIDLSNPSHQYDNIENITLTGSGNFTATGNALNNVLLGNGGSNVLSGLDGNDSLDGGLGNDNLSGGNGNDTITGGAGNDTLDGGLGTNALTGGEGNDIYIVSSATDKLTELADQGTDRVESSVTWVLGANFENLTLTGTGIANGTGNTLANIIIGNENENYLKGGGGNDTLYGGTGFDTLEGGDGDDHLEGGEGVDTMMGGAGNDLYTFVGGTGDADFIKDSAGTNDAVDFGVWGVLDANYFALDNDGNGKLDSLMVDFGSGVNLIIQDYFANNAATVQDSKAGAGLIETLYFADNSLDFSGVQQLFA